MADATEGSVEATIGRYAGATRESVEAAIGRYTGGKGVTVEAAIGACKGFLVCFLPLTLLRGGRVRRSVVRKGISVGIFTAVFRACQAQLKKAREEYERSPHGDGGEDAPALSELVRSVSLSDAFSMWMQYLRCGPSEESPTHRVVRAALHYITQKYGLALSAALASTALAIVDDGGMTNSVFVLWILVRTIRCLASSALDFPSLTPVFLLCLSSSLILSSWIVAPAELDPTYLHFLNVQGKLPKAVLKSLESRYPTTTTCHLVHPGQGCTDHVISYWIGGLGPALRLYIPLTLGMWWMSRERKPVHFFANLARSCCFLTSYRTLALCPACVWYKNWPPVTRFKLMSHTWMAGLSALFERPSRRPELAAYVSTYALDALYRMALMRGWVSPQRSVSWITLAFSFAVLSHHYEKQPSFVAHWLMGVPANHAGSKNATMRRKASGGSGSCSTDKCSSHGGKA